MVVFLLIGALLIEVILLSFALRPKSNFYTVDILSKTVTIFNYDKNCTFRNLIVKNFNQTITQTTIEIDYRCVNSYPMEYKGDRAEVSTIKLEKITPFIHIYTEKDNYKFSFFGSPLFKNWNSKFYGINNGKTLSQRNSIKNLWNIVFII